MSGFTFADASVSQAPLGARAQFLCWDVGGDVDCEALVGTAIVRVAGIGFASGGATSYQSGSDTIISGGTGAGDFLGGGGGTTLYCYDAGSNLDCDTLVAGADVHQLFARAGAYVIRIGGGTYVCVIAVLFGVCQRVV